MDTEIRRIVLAFMLRDMRTRFGRTHISYMISIGWPLVHLLFIFAIYVFTHKLAPVGDDPSIFAFTGLAPYILCLYPARFTAIGLAQNKPLLLFPVVSPVQLIFARAVLESLSAYLVFIIFFTILTLNGIATMPSDVYLAASVIVVTIYFSVGLGVFGTTLVGFHFMAGHLALVFFILGLYFSSGAVVPLSLAPPTFRELLWYNPLYQAVALLRCAYFDGADASDYSLSYVVLLGSAFLLLGLLGERLFRGRLLS